MYEREMEELRTLYKKGCFNMEMYDGKIKDEHVFDSYESFAQIPFSYKSDIRKTNAYDRTTCKRDGIYGLFSSSGTTGKKTHYIFSKDDKMVHEEFVKTFYTELGVLPEDLGAVCAPIDTGVMAQTMMWQFTTMGAAYVNCTEPSPENVAALVSDLPVTIIATRPNMASTMAYRPDWAETAKKSSVKKLFMGGGFLSKGRRKLLEETWGADCYNMFGMSEMFGPMAGECRCKNGQHFLNQYLLIEIINPETMQPVKIGETGVAVYTTLWDKGFPLLRYWTDDVMRLTFEKCECGSELPRLFCYGRKADCITIDGEDIFPIMLEEILMAHGFILDYQAVLEEDQSVTVKIEKPQNAEVTEAMVRKIEELFKTKISMQILEPGELKFFGHGKRFFQ